MYGKVANFAGRSLSDCPFRYQGQYEDSETGLYYNRFRYYLPEEGIYLSQDPIGLAGNNPTLYGYVKDPNTWIDRFGLDAYGPNQDVYALYNKADVVNGVPIEGAKPYYVGISQDSEVRLGQHTGKGRFDPKTDVKVDLHKNIDYATARAYEQKYIEDFGIVNTKSHKANQQNSFRHNRQDPRGKAFEAEYNRINKCH
jgi:RHS repeat-associated protein